MWLVIFIDLIFLNIELFGIYSFWHLISPAGVRYLSVNEVILCWNVTYLLSVLLVNPIAQNRLSRPEQVAARVFKTGLLQQLLFISSIAFLGSKLLTVPLALAQVAITLVLLFVSRMLSRELIKMIRRLGRSSRKVVYVGSSSNVVELYKNMGKELSTGYRIIGYFDDAASENYGEKLPYLGTVSDVIGYLEKNQIDQLYCALPSTRSNEVREILTYCENHLVRFYSVPNVRNYVRRKMNMEFINDVPVLSIREEALRYPLNRALKRAFDIVFSLLFICTIFIPILIVVSIIIKIKSPGPIFFKQKRNGLNGKEFMCYKFRSMKVNADADKVQATENDPRKYPFGDFMRRTNIDELPQFLNVLKGDMSIVGPRPHMLKHTEEYSALINRYMVRHFAKPGITGWAQVQGCRGETKELWQMEERIEKDIWYIEHWTFWLDLRIIYLTVRNTLAHNETNAY